jgi:hypothetical protein
MRGSIAASAADMDISPNKLAAWDVPTSMTPTAYRVPRTLLKDADNALV